MSVLFVAIYRDTVPLTLGTDNSFGEPFDSLVKCSKKVQSTPINRWGVRFKGLQSAVNYHFLPSELKLLVVHVETILNSDIKSNIIA